MPYRAPAVSISSPDFLLEAVESRRLFAAGYDVDLTAPWSRAVFQRDGRNVGSVIVEGTVDGDASRVEARAILQGEEGISTDWKKIDGAIDDGEFSGALIVPAGGWYRIDVRAVGAGGAGRSKSVSKVGVGDVYYLAGQSNMEGASASTEGDDDRVVMPVYSYGSLKERSTPTFARMEGHVGPAPAGKVGPAGLLGDLLAENHDVPVMFIQTSAAATSISEWRHAAETGDAGELKEYVALKQALKRYVPLLGGARAVLWQQGESDAQDETRTSAEEYADDLQYVIYKSRSDSDLPFLPWLVARVSSIKDTSPNVSSWDLEVERGQERVIQNDPNVFAGPLTDDLDRINGANVHYSIEGQKEHARRWFSRINGSLFSDEPVVSIGTIRAFAAETGRNGRITLFRTGPTAEALTVSFSVGGRARNGVDYREVGPTVTFQPGLSFAHVNIVAYDDGYAESSEAITLTLTDGPGYKLKSYDPVRSSPIGSSDDDELATISASVRISSSL